jgi:hypothetical protein
MPFIHSFSRLGSFHLSQRLVLGKDISYCQIFHGKISFIPGGEPVGAGVVGWKLRRAAQFPLVL